MTIVERGAEREWLQHVAFNPVRHKSPSTVQERGRTAITAGLRVLRQVVLLYGAAAVGAALASVLVLLLSELWLPFGLDNVKPANEVIGAWRRGDAGWVVFWTALVLLFAYLIRRYARGFVAIIALGSLGITLGGLIGLIGGLGLERLLRGSGAWNFLAEMSTGIVLVEGALAVLAAVYVGYWLLVWAVSRLSPAALMAITSLTVFGLLAGIAAAVSLAGTGALAALCGTAAAIWLGFELRRFFRTGQPIPDGEPDAGRVLPSGAVRALPLDPAA